MPDPQPQIDLSAGFVPKSEGGSIDLSSGFVPKQSTRSPQISPFASENLKWEIPAIKEFGGRVAHAFGLPTSQAEMEAQAQANATPKGMATTIGGALLGPFGPSAISTIPTLAGKGVEEGRVSQEALMHGNIKGFAAHQAGMAGYASNILAAPVFGESPARVGEALGSGQYEEAAAQSVPIAAPFVLGEMQGKAAPETQPIPGGGGGLRGAVRSTIGIGERFAQKTATEAIAEHGETAAKVTEANKAAELKHAQATARIQARQKVLDTETAEANKAAAAEHEQETARVEEINQAGQEAVGRRADLSRQIESDSTDLGNRVKVLEKQVRAVGSGKYQAVSQAVGDDTVPASDLTEAVNHAKNNIISGSQESIKQFGELLRKGEPQDVSTSMGTARPGDPLYDILVKSGAIEPTEQLGFRDLQGYYTELGQKMQAQGVPGDVYRALKYVREQIGNQMQAMAESHGVGEQLTDAKQFWRGYEQTFHDMRPVSQGGSPVARVLRAEDPAYVAAPVLGKASARTVSMLARYSEDAAGRAAALARNHAEMQGLPRKFTPKEAPEAPQPKTARQLEMPRPPVMKPTPETPDVIGAISEARAGEVARRARTMRRISGWDVASVAGGMYQIARAEVPTAFGVTVIRHGLGALLEHPRVAQWLSAPTAADFRALENIGDATQRESVRQAVAEVYKNRANEGRPLPMNAAAKAYLANAPKPDQPTLGPSAPGLGGTTRSISVNGQPAGSLTYDVNGDTLTVHNIGGPRANYDAMQNVLGQRGIAQLTDQLRQQHPEVKYVQGIRVGGARGEEARSVRLPMSRLPSTPKSEPTQVQPPYNADAGLSPQEKATAWLLAAKRGDVSQSEADRRIQRLVGSGGRKIKRPVGGAD